MESKQPQLLLHGNSELRGRKYIHVSLSVL